jgi:hypothetical protein
MASVISDNGVAEKIVNYSESLLLPSPEHLTSPPMPYVPSVVFTSSSTWRSISVILIRPWDI